MYKWVNTNADRGEYIYSLAVLDLFPFHSSDRSSKEKVKFEEIRFVNAMSKY